jgi:hypothetical protein
MVGKRWLFSALGLALVALLIAFGTVLRSAAAANRTFQVATSTLTATEPITSTTTITATTPTT